MAFSVIKTSDCNYKNVASNRRFEMFDVEFTSAYDG